LLPPLPREMVSCVKIREKREQPGKWIRNLVGKKFGRLTVVSQLPSSGHGTRWLCRCECLEEKIVTGPALLNGDTRSCGCLQREQAVKFNVRHGMRHTREYGAWRGMKEVCFNRKIWRWRKYGGRGITVCERWRGKHDFVNFLADMGPRPKGTTLVRLDENGNFEPKNCRWGKRVRQTRSPRGSKSVAKWGIRVRERG
jgi:hypothetical protein